MEFQTFEEKFQSIMEKWFTDTSDSMDEFYNKQQQAIDEGIELIFSDLRSSLNPNLTVNKNSSDLEIQSDHETEIVKHQMKQITPSVDLSLSSVHKSTTKGRQEQVPLLESPNLKLHFEEIVQWEGIIWNQNSYLLVYVYDTGQFNPYMDVKLVSSEIELHSYVFEIAVPIFWDEFPVLKQIGRCNKILLRVLPMGEFPVSSFSTEADTIESTPRESVKELYDKILDSVNVKRTMSPNAWLWSLISNCKNHEDIELLFDALQNLQRFRLSNLRINVNFNSHLCREITKACARVGAIDFGKKVLWKHNVYGLTPDIGCVNQLLAYAKEHNDINLMVEVMDLVKKNDIAIAPSAADNVLSICNNAGNWELMLKYSKKFILGGVKLRKSSFDAWMGFSVKRGDTKSLWRIEKLRSELWQQHTLISGFSCAKGLILERKPEDAAAVIQVLNQTLPENKKPGIAVQLQKLVDEWPLDVVKHQPEDKRKELAEALKSDIPAMVTALVEMGIEANVNLEDLTSKELTS